VSYDINETEAVELVGLVAFNVFNLLSVNHYRRDAVLKENSIWTNPVNTALIFIATTSGFRLMRHWAMRLSVMRLRPSLKALNTLTIQEALQS
jgi:hypothetical protein